MKHIGLELNAAKVRAVGGTAGEYPASIALEHPHTELPLVLSLEKSKLAIGSAGVRLQRQAPHLVCHDFLPHLIDPRTMRKWTTPRHRLDAGQVVGAMWKFLQAKCPASKSAVVTVPAYLNPAQIEAVISLGQKARFPVRGSLPAPLAAAMAAYAEQTWFGYGLVVDIDSHALSISTIRAADGRMEMVDTCVLPHISLSVWRERLLNTLADACVMQSRRDPRASPEAEQALFEQLDLVIEAGRDGRAIQIGLEARQWYQNLVVQPEMSTEVSRYLVLQVLQQVDSLWNAPWPEGPPGVILVTAEAGRLPGLADALREFFTERSLKYPRPAFSSEQAANDDFGEGLLDDERSEGGGVIVLPADALARAAHMMVQHCLRNEGQPAHIEEVPLPSPQPLEAGPARVHFQGQDYPLAGPVFSIGRRRGNNLVLGDDGIVADRHCEIVHERRCYMIVDHSRAGTLVNGCAVMGSAVLRAGDWIRLGAEGPLLRFLGRDRTQATIVTTA